MGRFWRRFVSGRCWAATIVLGILASLSLNVAILHGVIVALVFRTVVSLCLPPKSDPPKSEKSRSPEWPKSEKLLSSDEERPRRKWFHPTEQIPKSRELVDSKGVYTAYILW
jgi:hypothetical protein